MRISGHFYLEVFLCQTFYMLNLKVALGVSFRTATKYLKLSFYKSVQQMMPASIINV